jgi:hypothetical protein
MGGHALIDMRLTLACLVEDFSHFWKLPAGVADFKQRAEIPGATHP